MTRTGTLVLLGAITALVVGVGWVAVSFVRDAGASVTGAGAECTVALTAAAPATTLALSESSVVLSATGTVAEIPNTAALTLDAVQLQHASTINAVGLLRELPDRARVIALATALQESSLRNLPDGDRDSLGLFQQRPSQGWGSVAEIGDPVYASNAFYDALLDVPDWAGLSLTDAAQAVQYSGFPDAYAKWEPAASRLTVALSSAEPGLVDCRAGAVAPTADTPGRPAVAGVEAAVPGLATLIAEAQAELGGLTVAGLADDGRTATVDASIGGLDAGRSAAVVAAWTVAHATGAGVSHVAVADRLWFDHAWGALDPAAPAGRVRVTLAG
ncbi:hypothetical protein [Nakamurella deserti]|uniref:hypothetical protein n=1 Tax=Nakamurella deserti TaxID=2164074 RepID=UPI000DBE56D6|nr:hypothetical protein [Nakamurella deserti]